MVENIMMVSETEVKVWEHVSAVSTGWFFTAYD
jgi:hypothetical protein